MMLREANKAEVDALKRENERLNELVAQLSVENLVLKKALVRAHGQALCEKGGPAQGRGPSDRRKVSSAGQADPPRVADSTIDVLPVEEQVWGAWDGRSGGPAARAQESVEQIEGGR